MFYLVGGGRFLFHFLLFFRNLLPRPSIALCPLPQDGPVPQLENCWFNPSKVGLIVGTLYFVFYVVTDEI